MQLKKVGKILARVALAIVVFILILILIAQVLQKQIVQKAVHELNKSITVPVLVDDVSFTLIKRFPNATIQFKNVNISSGSDFNSKYFYSDASETLAVIENVFVSINLLALLNSTIQVKKVEINGAQINVLIDEKGKSNYQIFSLKKEKEPTDSSIFNIELNELAIIDSKVLFNNLYKKSQFHVNAPNFKAKGALKKNSYFIETEGDLLLGSLRMGKFNYQPKHPASLQLNMSYSNDTLTLHSSKIKAQKSQFNVTGFSVFGKSTYTNIQVTGDKVPIEHVVEFLPIKEQVKDFKSSGHLKFNGIIKGNVSNTKSPYLLAHFGISNGSILYKDSISVQDINLKGRFSNGKKRNAETMSLSLKEFTFTTDSSAFNGDFKLDNFNNPRYIINSEFVLDLKEFNPFFSDDHISDISGFVKGKINTNGQVNDDVAYDSIGFIMDNTIATLNFDAVSFKLPSQGLRFDDMSSLIMYKRNNITSDSISGLFNGIKSKGLNVRVSNLNAVFKDIRSVSLIVNGDFFFDKVNYAQLEPLFKSDGQTTDPMSYLIEGNLSVQKFTYKNILATNLVSSLRIKNNDYTFNKLSFNAFDGSINTSLRYLVKSDKKVTVQNKTQTKGLNISSYFEAFNNFGQKNLQAQNINGNLTSDFECELNIVNGKADMNSIDLLGYAKIENGQLIDYEPIQELARFTNIDELNNVSFSTIETELLISDNVVHFPQMEISSNAFDITLFGKQNFSGDYEYHIKLYLSDIVSGKSKKLQKQQSEFGEVEDDGLGRTSLFLVSTSTNGKVKTRFDRKQLRQHLKDEFSQEKQELKQIFGKENTLFKSDTTKPVKPKSEQNAFEIEWDDD